jgi:secreted trypsin-like serine protease
VIFVTRNRRLRRVSMLLLPVALLGLAVVAAGPADAVANGEVVPNGRYEFAAKITAIGIPTADGGKRDSACSAALIAPQWIITAGHCFRDVNGVRVEHTSADSTTVTVGRADLTTSVGQVATIVAVRQSPTTDVSVAELSEPIRDVRPIALSRHAPENGSVVRLTGYGATSHADLKPSDQLRTGQFTVTSVSDSVVGVTGRAPSPDTSACPFDSGAPYFAERRYRAPVLVSVESTGPACPHAQEETTSRVDNIADWIHQVIGE